MTDDEIRPPLGAHEMFSTPGAEFLEDDPDHLAQDTWDQSDEPTEFIIIEQWSTQPNRQFFPDIDTIIEWVIEWTVDRDTETNEGWAESAEQAGKRPAVRDACASFMKVLAENTSYRMADRHLADWCYQGGTAEDPPVLVWVRPTPRTRI